MDAPSDPANEQAAGDPVRERLAIFEDAVQRLRQGTWTADAFGTWLEEVARQMTEREKSLQEIYSALPPELEEVFLEEAEIGFRGIALYQVGINLLRGYVQSHDDAVLDQALDSMRAGNGLINEAMRINRTNREDEQEEPAVSPDLDEVEEEVI